MGADALDGPVIFSAAQRRKPDAALLAQRLDRPEQARRTLWLSEQAGHCCQPRQVLGDVLPVAPSPDEREALLVEHCGLWIVAHAQGDCSQMGQSVGDGWLVARLPCD